MKTDDMVRLCKRHTIYTWSASDGVDPLPLVRAEGPWMITADGERLLDFNSGAMSVHVGYGEPRVIDAMKRQLDELSYAVPASATPVRARLGKLLSEVAPGDINVFLFCNSGAEANENAIKTARMLTGRQKILSRYRSYHGSSNATMQLTGDPRRWANEPGGPGFIRVLDPWPYDFSFGANEAEVTERSIKYLEEIIRYEGAHTIAAFFIETVTGTNGVLPPPAGYLEAVRELTERHGILLVCDEVMAGFGRTGRWFACEHDDIVPDIITMAKGVSSSYAPLGVMGVRDYIADHFKTNTYWGGHTYNAHPLALAAAEANIRVIADDGLVARSAALGEVMGQELARLAAKHPSIKAHRNLGLFGMVDLQKSVAGEAMAPYAGSSEAMQELKAFFRANGLYVYVRWGSFMCVPPLIITEEQLRDAFAIIDRGLEITDRHCTAD